MAAGQASKIIFTRSKIARLGESFFGSRGYSYISYLQEYLTP
jgi:hypothetical protein